MTWTWTTTVRRMTAPSSRTSPVLPTCLAHRGPTCRARKGSKGRGPISEALECRALRVEEEEDLMIFVAVEEEGAHRISEVEARRISEVEVRRISEEVRIFRVALGGRARTTRALKKVGVSMEDKEVMMAGRTRTARGRESSSRAREGASEEGACLRTKVVVEWAVVTPATWVAGEEAWARGDLRVAEEEVQAWTKAAL